MKQELAPIVLFVYNRLDVLKSTIEALQKNVLAENSLLFIFSDGPKNESDAVQVMAVRKYIHEITGFLKIEIFEKEKNAGLAGSVISGVSQVVGKYKSVIVVEDDILTSPYFLKFMNEALDLYRNDDEVACISGYSYDMGEMDERTFFLTGEDCWGWATWERAWNLFEEDTRKLLKRIDDKKLKQKLNYERGYDLYGMLCAQRDGYVSSWSVRWDAALTLEGKLCLFPSRTLVSNLGYGSGTHCGSMISKDSAIDNSPVLLKRIPLEMREDILQKYLESQEKRFPITFTGKLKNLLKKFLPFSVLCFYRRIRDRKK